MKTKQLEPMYSVEEAGKKLGGVSRWTIYAWMSRGKLERTRVGGRVMVKESSLLKLIRECSKKKVSGRGKKGGSRVAE